MTKSIVRVPVENCTDGSSLGTEALDVNATLTVPEISTEYGDDNAIDNSNDCVGFTLSGNPVSDNVGNGCGGCGVGSGGGGVGSGGGGVVPAIIRLKVREAIRGFLPLSRSSATWTVNVNVPAV
jgi:hypothetical protein